MTFPVVVNDVGALLFGVVIGWVTYRTLRRSGPGAAISDIASVIGAVVGTSVTGVFSEYIKQPEAFGLYLIGLFVGFFGFYILSLFIVEDTASEALIREPEN